MHIKRIISFLLVIIASFCLFSCGTDDSTSENVTPQFKNGYYIGDRCTMEITFVGSNSEISYNVAFYNKDTGEAYYQGTVHGVDEKDNSVSVTNYDRKSSVVNIEKSGDVFCVKCPDNTYEHEFVCGDYSYVGTEWLSQAEIENGRITVGEYHITGYTLFVDAENGVTSFVIKEAATGDVVFEAKSNAEISNKVGFSNEYGNISLTSGCDGSNQYVSVTDENTGKNYPFLGKYALQKNDYFSYGEYTLNDWFLTYTKFRDKSNVDEYNYIIEFTLIDDTGKPVFSDSVSIPAEQHLHSISFETESGEEISLFKGINEEEDYVDVITTDVSFFSGRFYLINK